MAKILQPGMDEFAVNPDVVRVRRYGRCSLRVGDVFFGIVVDPFDVVETVVFDPRASAGERVVLKAEMIAGAVAVAEHGIFDSDAHRRAFVAGGARRTEKIEADGHNYRRALE